MKKPKKRGQKPGPKTGKNTEKNPKNPKKGQKQGFFTIFERLVGESRLKKGRFSRFSSIFDLASMA